MRCGAVPWAAEESLEAPRRSGQMHANGEMCARWRALGGGGEPRGAAEERGTREEMASSSADRLAKRDGIDVEAPTLGEEAAGPTWRRRCAVAVKGKVKVKVKGKPVPPGDGGAPWQLRVR